MNTKTEEVLNVEDRIKIADRIKEVISSLNKLEAEKLRNEGYVNEINEHKWKAREKKKYFNLDVGSSGAFMVDRITGEIFNIKAYGQIDKNKKIKANLGNIKTCDIKTLHSKRWNYLR